MITRRTDYRHVSSDGPISAAIGYFDGFHEGHLQLINEAIAQAGKRGIHSAIITFDPDPWTVFKPDANRDHLLEQDEKERFAKALGADELIIIDFSKEFASLSPEKFHQMLRDLGVKNLVCGFDFTYGYKGSGSPQTLKNQKDFDVEVIDSVNDDKGKISSSRIESLIRQGEVAKAGELLGYFYSIAGTVEHGFKRGSRLLGFPTANIRVPDQIVLPEKGVYAGYAETDGKIYPCMINVGRNPTFENEKISIEGNLFDFDQDLYGKKIRYFFAARIRPEQKFSSPELLRKQLEKDRNETRKLLARKQPLLQPTLRLWSLNPDFVIMHA